MVCFLLFVDANLPLDHLVVGACSVAPIQCGPLRDWSGDQGQLNGQLAFFAVSRPVVSGPVVIIPNLDPVLVYNLLPEYRIVLLPTSWVPMLAVYIRVPCDDCATCLLAGSVPVKLPCMSLCSLYLSLIIQIDNPCDLFSSSLYVPHHDITIRDPAQIVLASVPDSHFGSGSRSEPNSCQFGGAGCQNT